MMIVIYHFGVATAYLLTFLMKKENICYDSHNYLFFLHLALTRIVENVLKTQSFGLSAILCDLEVKSF